MGALTLLVVPDDARHLVTALRDLSALGLVTPFSWTTPELSSGPEPGGVLCVGEGGSRAGKLDREVAVQDPELIRVVVVSQWEEPGGAVAALDAAEAMLAPLPPSTVRVHLVLAPAGGSAAAPVGRGGWHNIVISPEDGYRPGAVHSAWDSRPGLSVEGRRVAHTVAALAGLLRDHPATWVDELRTPPSEAYRVARVYYRRLDGRAVEDSIHVQLFDMASGLPRVWAESRQAGHFSAPADAAAAMAKRWWATAQRDLTSSRSRVPAAQVQQIDVWAAIKLFFGYLLAAIRNAPAAWVRGLVRGAGDKLTTAVGGHVFGNSSAFRVVLGRNGEEPASPHEVAEALRALDDALPHPGDGSPAHEHAWKALVEGALVLGDAAGGSGAMAFQESSQLATVGSPDNIVAPLDTYYEVQSWGLRPHLAGATVAAGDFLGMLAMQRELERVVADPTLGADASVEIQSLRSWWQGQSTTYAARTAQLLGAAHLSAMKEIDALGGQLQGDEERLAREAQELSASQRSSRRRVLVWLALGLLLTVLFVVLGVWAILTAGVAAALAAAALLGGLAGAFVTFYRNQQRLFQLLHRLDESAQLAPVLKQNLAAAVRDARTTVDAYELHQRWVTVLRLFLQDPFGSKALPPVDELRVEGDLPLAAAIGAGLVDEVLVAREVMRLQHRYFPRGWLHDVWQRHLDALPAHLGVAGVRLTRGADLLGQRGADATALLDRVITTVTEKGPPSVVGQQTWQRALTDLEGAAAQGRELMPQVRLVGLSQVADRAEFERRMRGAGTPVTFHQHLFDATALTDGLNQPVDDWQDAAARGLSASQVLITYSQAMEPQRLVRFQPDGPATGPSRPIDDPTF